MGESRWIQFSWSALSVKPESETASSPYLGTEHAFLRPLVTLACTGALAYSGFWGDYFSRRDPLDGGVALLFMVAFVFLGGFWFLFFWAEPKLCGVLSWSCSVLGELWPASGHGVATLLDTVGLERRTCPRVDWSN